MKPVSCTTRRLPCWGMWYFNLQIANTGLTASVSECYWGQFIVSLDPLRSLETPMRFGLILYMRVKKHGPLSAIHFEQMQMSFEAILCQYIVRFDRYIYLIIVYVIVYNFFLHLYFLNRENLSKWYRTNSMFLGKYICIILLKYIHNYTKVWCQ